MWFKKVFKEFDETRGTVEMMMGFMDGILLCLILGMFVIFSLV